MATKKPTAPLHKVLAAQIRNVDGPEYTPEERLGVQKFLSALLGGRRDSEIKSEIIKPVTVPGHQDGIRDEYAVLSSNVGLRDAVRTLTALTELKRQRKVAKKKRADAKKAKSAAPASEAKAGAGENRPDAAHETA